MIMFSKIRDKEELKEILRENFLQINNTNKKYDYYFKTVREGIKSINRLDLDKEKKLLDYTKWVDIAYDKYDDYDEVSSKFNCILGGAIYIDKYFDRINSLENDELALLSNFSSNIEPDQYEMYLNIYTKDILSKICKKISSKAKRKHILIILDNKNIINKKDILNYIDSATNSSIENDYNEYIEGLAEYTESMVSQK